MGVARTASRNYQSLFHCSTALASLGRRYSQDSSTPTSELHKHFYLMQDIDGWSNEHGWTRFSRDMIYYYYLLLLFGKHSYRPSIMRLQRLFPMLLQGYSLHPQIPETPVEMPDPSMSSV